MGKIDKHSTYIINPVYTLRHDIHRAIITNSKGVDTIYNQENIVTSFCWLLHPVLASIFTYIDGSLDLDQTMFAIAEDFDMSDDQVSKIVFPVIENESNVLLHFLFRGHVCNTIPKNFIIKKTNSCDIREFDIDDFTIPHNEWDLEAKRLYIPSSITFMLNNKCSTNCAYCYADKNHFVEKELDFERVKVILQEAASIGIIDFSISGGEVFLYPYWRELLSLLYYYGYDPYISTKIPLTEKDISDMQKIGLKRLQISFDADDPSVLQKILKVGGDYYDKMINTFSLLEKYNIEVVVKSVITKYNCNMDSVKMLLRRLDKYKNITHVSIAPAESSLYKNFEDYNVSKTELDKIINYAKSYTYDKDLIVQDYTTGDTVNSTDFKLKENIYNQRAQCTANFTALYILPDGKVGICEELYWHPDFIVGDLNYQTIMDVWNSDKANRIYSCPQELFPEDTPCKTCRLFDTCRKNKGVCWKMVYHAYGRENIIYNPDPRCPYAKKPTNIFYYMD